MRIDVSLAHALLFWGIVPVLWGCLFLKGVRCALVVAVIVGLGIGHVVVSQSGLGDLFFHLGTFSLALLIPYCFLRSQKALSRNSVDATPFSENKKPKCWRFMRPLFTKKANGLTSWNDFKIGSLWFR